MNEVIGARIRELKEKLQGLRSHLDLDTRQKELDKIEIVMASPDFWKKEQAERSGLGQQRAVFKNQINSWKELNQRAEDAEMLAQLSIEEDDGDTLKEVAKDVTVLEKQIADVERQLLLGDPNDIRNAIISINSGAGGTESQDWVEMLFRMYSRWCEEKAMKMEILDHLPGEEAGIKNITFSVEGSYAFGYLKSEHGIHRMVRISPFDASGRRHTSFASVSVYPELPTDIKIEIDEKDIRIDIFRSSGPGGQHVNKTSSAVRITHFPTGIVVQCQNEKSQHRNRDTAFKILKARIYSLEQEKLEKKKHDLHHNQKEIAWGSQIRSYVFNPYRLVKDHRTGVEIGDVDSVMNGSLDTFMDSYLRSRKPELLIKKAASS
ncbi:MAG: peptide chain release factor 2 [Deltaproteobacteria bacterium CG_4_8_14_3_um_filter_51_11]|nr:peptide chain release factor 2 [bacterium]NCP09546.1 peptide chain release factor 2 [bacterium]PIP45194.1 MAG: peptide chain release factor 2 [Deltaproteobacteria bacterium CG23_combo_of_CG06-09_8_20_14_all_51_20]PIX19334.1 MAG: peptide chain release factor 2 [Deltaproteobacteria bacterium CG_4_8_14_3_um_filter_51_11]PJB34947.1 MAG: peptide chain release factor 2 [Deltaproteobacteria bacterium CG_4_9_14_3_um_filter_51_14]